MTLPPTNITVSQNVNNPTYNYDSAVAACYALGEYLGATQTSAGAVAAWGGERQLWKEPPGAIIGGVHSQEDVSGSHTEAGASPAAGQLMSTAAHVAQQLSVGAERSPGARGTCGSCKHDSGQGLPDGHAAARGVVG